MALQLAPDQPEARQWRAESLTVAAATVMQPAQDKAAGHRPVVLAVDGRSSSGKTTLTGQLRGVVAGSAVVHTDDIAWWHSRFGWADLMIDGVLLPARAGQPVTFRPPQWDQRQRPGAIEVPAGCPLLIIEGVGAARRETARLADAAIWVQSDEREAERRSLARVGRPGGPLTVRHYRDWMAEEMTVRGPRAALGTCRPHHLRHPGDLLRSRYRARGCTPADPDMTTTGTNDRPGTTARPSTARPRVAAGSRAAPLTPAISSSDRTTLRQLTASRVCGVDPG